MILVYLKPVTKSKKGDLLTDLGKLYKTMRFYAHEYRVNKMIAVVTSFNHWHFCQYDITKEVDHVCGPQMEAKLQELKGTGSLVGDQKFCTFKKEPLKAFETTSTSIDLYDKSTPCEKSLLKVVDVLNKLVEENFIEQNNFQL